MGATDFTLSSASSVTKDGITVEFGKGSGSTAPAWYDAGLRLYASNTITITCEKNIAAISFNWEKQGNKAFASVTANVGNYTHPTAAGIGNWTGSAKSITFTVGNSGQLQLNTFSVTVESAVSQFTITPATNNNDWGTVSLAGSAITATPSSGYRVSTTNPYEVSPSDAATVSQTGNVFTVNATADCTVTINFEAIPTFEVTISTPEGGMLTVKNGDETVNSGDRFETGTVLTVTATPDENYNFRNWQAVDASTHTYTASNTGSYTMTEHDVTFNATFDAKVYYNVSWSVNGIITKTEKYEEGNTIVFPETPADIAGKAFVGWVTAAMDGTTDEAPEFVTSATMGTADVTYYAVFANVTKGNHENVVDEITASDLAATSTTYTDFSGVEKTSAAVYAGQSAGGNNAIQLRSNNSNSGIITTTSGGKLKKVTVEWNSNTASGRTLDIYGKNAAYEAAADLYDTNKQGTKLGSIVKGTSTELVVDGDYSYIGLRSNSGAMYLSSISITWETGTPDTYSDYCTTVPAPESVSATIASSGYTTFCSPFDLSFENVEGLEAAYVVTTSTTSTATLKKVTAVPAGKGVILKGTTGAVTIPVAEYTGEAISNILVGTLTATHVDTETVYVVSDGMFKLFAGTEIPAGKAYLPASAIGSNAPSLSFDFGGETTGINSVERGAWSVEGCYTLDGRRVAEPTKGLYIVNGKKVVIK